LKDDGTVGNTWSRLKPTDTEILTSQTKHSASNNVNGLYADPSIYRSGSFAGIRALSDRLGNIVRDEICVVGTEYGVTWWATEGGSFVDKVAGTLSVGSLSGTIHNGSITFDDAKQWIQMTAKANLHLLPRDLV
jgi:hypothetical protein